MAVYGNPKEDKVCVDWLGENEKCTRYFEEVDKKKLFFIGSEQTKKEAEGIKNFRERKYRKKTIIKELGGEFLLYSE